MDGSLNYPFFSDQKQQIDHAISYLILCTSLEFSKNDPKYIRKIMRKNMPKFKQCRNKSKTSYDLLKGSTMYQMQWCVSAHIVI